MVRPPSGRVPSRDGAAHELAQDAEVQRLGHEIERAQLERADGGLDVAVGVITATGTCGKYSWIQPTRSSPSPSGRRMSVRHRSKWPPFSSFCAVPTSEAVRVSMLMRESVRLTSSRRSGSSSTMSTVGLVIEALIEIDTVIVTPSGWGRRIPVGKDCRRPRGSHTAARRRSSAQARAPGTGRARAALAAR